MAITVWNNEIVFEDNTVAVGCAVSSDLISAIWNAGSGATATINASQWTRRATGYLNCLNNFSVLHWNVDGRNYSKKIKNSQNGLYYEFSYTSDGDRAKLGALTPFTYISYIYLHVGRGSVQWDCPADIGYLVDTTNQLAKPFMITKGTSSYSSRELVQWRTLGGGTTTQAQHQLFLDLTNALPVVLDYKPVANLYSTNGNTQLSMSKQATISDGERKQGLTADAFLQFTQQTEINARLNNMATGDKILLAYCGDNRAYLTKMTDTEIGGVLNHRFALSFSFGSQLEDGDLTYVYPWVATSEDYFFFALIIDTTNQFARPSVIRHNIGNNLYYVNEETITNETVLNKYYRWLTAYGDTPERPDPFEDKKTNGADGGINFIPRDSNPNTPQALPTLSGVDTNFIQLFAPSSDNLSALATYMWDDNFITQIKRLFSNPIDIILSLSLFPFAVPTGDIKTIQAGNIETPVLAPEITTRWFEIDCGTMDITPVWDAYLDFSPYTKIDIYLPYCGTHSLDVDELMQTLHPDRTITTGASIRLRYLVDVVTGGCVAQLILVHDNIEEVRYQFTGTCNSEIPLNAQNYSNLVHSLLTTVATVGVTVATGGMSAPATAGALGTAVVSNVLNGKPQIEKSGICSSVLGMMSLNYPYIAITEPIQAYAEHQFEFTGLPNYYARVIGSCVGYTKFIDAHLDNIVCLESERDEIMTLLKSGVII